MANHKHSGSSADADTTLLSLIKRFCTRETITYLICGVITTAINIATGMLCYYRFHLSTLTSSNIAWFTAVIFAFYVNKVFVFQSKSWALPLVWHEFYTFMIARLLSLMFDDLFMHITVDKLFLPFSYMKIADNVFVMVMNYFASKFISFRKPAKKDVSEENET